MTISNLRWTLEEARRHAQQGDLQQTVHSLDDALQALDAERLLTTTQAAQYLGIRSVNTLKLLVRKLGVPYEQHGNRMMIPVEGLERIQQDTLVQGIRASDRAHDKLDVLLVGDKGLSDRELAILEATRPGRLPWENEEDVARHRAALCESKEERDEHGGATRSH